MLKSSNVDRISTRPLADKLGIKGSDSVALLGIAADDFSFAFPERVNMVHVGSVPKGTSMVFFLVEDRRQLQELSRIATRIARNGAIWVVRERGGAVNEMDVIDAGKRHGLVDNKVVRFSETHSAMRLVIPVAKR